MFWIVNSLLVVFSAALAGKVLRHWYPDWELFGKGEKDSQQA